MDLRTKEPLPFIPVIVNDPKMQFRHVADLVGLTELRCHYGVVLDFERVKSEVFTISKIYPKHTISFIFVLKDGSYFPLVEKYDSKGILNLELFFEVLEGSSFFAVMYGVSEPKYELPVLTEDKIVLCDSRGNYIGCWRNDVSKVKTGVFGVGRGLVSYLNPGHIILTTETIQDHLNYYEKKQKESGKSG